MSSLYFGHNFPVVSQNFCKYWFYVKWLTRESEFSDTFRLLQAKLQYLLCTIWIAKKLIIIIFFMMNNDQILLFFKNLYLSNFEYDKKALRVYGKITCIVYVCFLVHNESKCSERRVGSITFLPFWGNYDRPTNQPTNLWANKLLMVLMNCIYET